MVWAGAMKRLTEMFADERAKLEGQWDRGGDVSTGKSSPGPAPLPIVLRQAALGLAQALKRSRRRCS